MTSKNLYFKLIREDLKRRLWAVALISLGCFFLYPVVAAFMAGEIQDYRNYEEGLRWYTRNMVQWLAFENVMTLMIMMGSAVICGFSSFSYLNSRSKVDFYHSIPVRREKLYVVNFLNGIMIMLVPYGISLLLAAVIGMSNGIEAGKLVPVAFHAFVLHSVYFILMYATVVIAAMMTGNLIIGFLGSNVFAFFVPIAAAVLNAYYQSFFDTFVQQSDTWFDWAVRISPVMEYFNQISRYMEDENVWPAALAALVIAVVLAVLGCILYRKRPSEAAGKAMAFPVSCAIIRIPIVVISSLGFGLFFWSMRHSMGWAVFGVVCGAMISHCVIEILYHFDFKKLFSHKLQLMGCILVSMAVLCIFRYDVVGYDRYLPSAEDVKAATIEVSILNDWASYGTAKETAEGGYTWARENPDVYIENNMNYQDVENLLAIASAGIERTLNERDRRLGRQERGDSGGIEAVYRDAEIMTILNLETEESALTTMMEICYTLNSGSRVYRRYSICLDDVMPQIEKMYQDEQYQKGTFPLMQRTVDEIATIRYKEEGDDIRLSGLTVAEKKELLETFQQEFASLTIEQMKKEYPVGLIRFTTIRDEAALDWQRLREELRDWDRYDGYYGRDFDRYDYYPVYPSFTKTLKLLRGYGIEPRSYIRQLEVQSMRIFCYSQKKEEQVAITITDPAEIDQLKEIMIMGRRGYYNNIYQMDNVYGEVTTMEDGQSQIEHVNFTRGEVPEFVKERLLEEVQQVSR